MQHNARSIGIVPSLTSPPWLAFQYSTLLMKAMPRDKPMHYDALSPYMWCPFSGCISPPQILHLGGTMININNNTSKVSLNKYAKISLRTPTTIPSHDSTQTFTVANSNLQGLRLRTYPPWRCTRLDDNERPFVYSTRRFVRSSLVNYKETNSKARFSKSSWATRLQDQ